MMFYSESTNGFYNYEIHGNSMPADAVEISDVVYTTLLEGQSSGKLIQSDKSGFPILVDVPPITGNELVKLQIAELESTITTRRIREAVLGIDGGWLVGKNAEIESLRSQLV